MPKLRTYALLSHTAGPAPYVLHTMSMSQRSALAKIRNGTFPINIETGRYRALPLDQRLCPVCDNGQVETEAHFLLHCDHYDELRKNFLQKLQSVSHINVGKLSQNEQLEYILNNDNATVSRITTCYIKSCFASRMVN